MNNRSEIEDMMSAGVPPPEPDPRFWRNTHCWIITALFVLGIILHYPQQILRIDSPSLFTFLESARFSAERVFFLIPVFYAGFAFGLAGGVTSLLLSIVVMLPRAAVIATDQPDAILDIVMIAMVGIVLNLWLEWHRRERGKREQAMQTLEVTKQEIQQYIHAVENSEKALATINAVCLVASQTLDLQKVLDTTVERVRDAMDLDVALAFLLDEDTQELELRAYRGVSAEFVEGLRGLRVGEGFNGTVAQTGQPLLVANSASDPRLTREVVRQEGLLAQLIVPLKASERVVGTLCVAGRYARQFKEEEIDLLTTIGRQVGVAIENSRLYEHERLHAEEQKQLQERLRYYLRLVTRAQEKERQRIAQELHDDTIQDLVLLLHKIDRFSAVASFLPPQEILFLEELRQRIHVISDEVRRFTQDLRPSVLDDLGLLPALEWLAQDVSKHFDIKVLFSSSGQARRFNPETELTLFRIVQEALRNVWKHSGATEAKITVEFMGDKVTLAIEDNGQGFELPARVEDLATAGKLGLVGMRERAQLIGARLSVKSEPGKGAIITVELPIASENLSMSNI
ncbi:MAG: GAF domain-containing sensor histidine kinase [Dehalococcoidia bacterium]|nr:GAF domain-containing sensor histidine kinase [Dehalococcoidia bacterium]